MERRGHCHLTSSLPALLPACTYSCHFRGLSFSPVWRGWSFLLALNRNDANQLTRGLQKPGFPGLVSTPNWISQCSPLDGWVSVWEATERVERSHLWALASGTNLLSDLIVQIHCFLGVHTKRRRIRISVKAEGAAGTGWPVSSSKALEAKGRHREAVRGRFVTLSASISGPDFVQCCQGRQTLSPSWGARIPCGRGTCGNTQCRGARKRGGRPPRFPFPFLLPPHQVTGKPGWLHLQSTSRIRPSPTTCISALESEPASPFPALLQMPLCGFLPSGLALCQPRRWRASNSVSHIVHFPAQDPPVAAVAFRNKSRSFPCSCPWIPPWPHLS